MKTINLFLTLSVFTLSCTSVRTFDETTSNYDDIYYNPDDEKAPAPPPAIPPAQTYQFKENTGETRVVEPPQYSQEPQEQNVLSDRGASEPQNDRGYSADGYSYEEHFGRINGNRNYNRGYNDGYEDALDDQYYSGNFYSYRAPVYHNSWRRGWGRPYYRSYPRNNFWVGYSHRNGWNYGYSYGWGYNGWNCYGPSWYDPYPFGYGCGVYGGFPTYGYGGWGSPWYGHSGYGWGTPWYGYSGAYYRPYNHYPYYGYGGGYRVIRNPGGSGGSGGSGGGVIIHNPGNGTVHAPRTNVGTNGPTIGRSDPSSPRGRGGQIEAPGKDGAMDPTQGGVKESTVRPDVESGRSVKDGNEIGRNNLPQETGPSKSDGRPDQNQRVSVPEQGRPSGDNNRTPVSADRPIPGSNGPLNSGQQVRENKQDQPVSVPSEQPGREGRGSQERPQPTNPVPVDREYRPGSPSNNDYVRPEQPRQDNRPAEDNRRYESRPTPSYERPTRESTPSRDNEYVRPSQPRQETRPAEENRRYESRPTPSYERPSRETAPSRSYENVRPSQPRQESRPQPSYTPQPQRSQPSRSPQPSSGGFSRESSPSPSGNSSPGGSGGHGSSSGRGRGPR